MARAIRSKKSTVANSVETFRLVSNMPEPTRDLNPRAMEHFKAIVTSREAGSFSAIDLVIATNAALTLDAIDAQWDDIDENGWKVFSERGTPVTNPAADQLAKLGSSLRAYVDKLGMSASQRGLSGGPQASRNVADRKAREVIEKAKDDSLLA